MSGRRHLPAGARARVITVSDRAYRGIYADRSGPLLVAGLVELGFEVGAATIVPDGRDEIVAALRSAVADGVDLVVSTGGTGLGPRDVTPEATREVIERAVPGLAEALRAAGRETVPAAMLSRGLVGTVAATLVVNLPGSTGGVRDGLGVLAGVVGHAVAQLRGADDHGHPAAGSAGPAAAVDAAAVDAAAVDAAAVDAVDAG
ncbi:molybdenum cofactor biosynthesis protein [Frankia sp. CcI156]|uniref:MogA/MoaB family molybdenum cofactor biosynthesis protein n=1 Tax=Frankia TaxID=1854 RepID=UPI0003CFDEDC|nr:MULTISPECIES: MogA/MoaB family molybdenum cofactor biosynthesis protein [Frankia]ETA02016.1 molybdopterin adenylyltransferase [Frankia sp. CcI6]KFB04221.1 molybdopterin adenylyltransferase [Frankia sp. Allo2]OAA23186.1 molybdopterin adenylyltransferase [Frankia casuarinae]OHV53687.1 molybdenum cofactor biosynthesis protein [Frankia sp. CgIS1]ONH25318.1 molybdenum cofactor biosynthesis protein [Frankia sp. CcI156]